MKIKPKLGQSILGFVFAFIVLAALAIGMTRIWAWFTINYGARQAKYQLSRIEATQPAGNYLTQQPNEDYQPIDLTEDWLFDATSTETIDYTRPTFPELEDADAACRKACPQCVIHIPAGCDCDLPGCACAADPNCVCYIQCMCRQQIKPRLQVYDEQYASLEKAAASMRKEAAELEKQAKKCDDPWEICWWAGFGISAKKLKQAAANLKRQAATLCCGPTSQAGIIMQEKNEILACCDEPTVADREVCMEEVSARQCPRVLDGEKAFWQDAINDIMGEINLANAIETEVNRRINSVSIGCPKWVYLRCKYSGCATPAKQICDQKCVDEADVNCEDRCRNDCTDPGPPVVFDPACYNTCLTSHCQHACTPPATDCDWYSDFYDDCKNATYPSCLKTESAACTNNCMASPAAAAYKEECCKSFCCVDNTTVTPNTWSCSWGIFDYRTHGYTHNCHNWEEDSAVFKLDGTGDGCRQTWDYYIEDIERLWWMGVNNYLSPCRNGDEWGRKCVVPTSACDEDCSEEGPLYFPAPPIQTCDVCDHAATYTRPLSCFTGLKDKYGNDIMERCGLQTLANRQSAAKTCFGLDIAKWKAKIDKADCCYGQTNDKDCCGVHWVLDPADPPAGIATADCNAGETHFECQSRCIAEAAQVCEDPKNELGQVCLNQCAGLVGIDLEDCIRNCTGAQNDCCTQWCLDEVHGIPPQDYINCINACIANPAGYGCPIL